MTAYAANISQPPRTLTQHEQRLLLKTCGEHPAGYRDHVIFSMALGTGLREHEILALDVGDIFVGDRARRRFILQVFKRSSQAPAHQEVVLPDTLRAKLDKLYRWKRSNGESVTPEAPVFLSRNGNRLSARQLRERFRYWQKRAGFERIFSFHSARHSAITNIYEATRDIRLAQRFARHKSITSTQIYTHPSDETLFRAVQDLPC